MGCIYEEIFGAANCRSFHDGLGRPEEVMHEAFVRVWNHRDNVEPKTLKGLLYKTVQNVALNEIRRQKLKSTLQVVNWLFTETSPTPEAEIIEAQDLQRMRVLLESMPHDLREVLLLAQYSDLSYEEISATLGVPSGTVASRKSRALEWLRQKMEDRNV